MKNTGQIFSTNPLDADGDSSSTSPTSSSSSSSSSDETIEHCDLIAYDDVSDPSGAKEFPFTLSVTVMVVNDHFPHIVTSSLTINHNDKLVKDFIFNETIILADKDASTKHGLTIEPSQPEWKERLKFIEDARQSNGFQLQLLKVGVGGDRVGGCGPVDRVGVSGSLARYGGDRYDFVGDKLVFWTSRFVHKPCSEWVGIDTHLY